ncbi:uncharacterized protein DEA37_0005305 [Paragonimus westermani]|uniref:Uncharacterized protein n=2 Tax=Paragonimus westermani TaxID=34504 RepID=A0A5J4P087_9TREM|nr:uncharacterized protein DEA37_0005305 [Paragonimus westermani]
MVLLSALTDGAYRFFPSNQHLFICAFCVSNFYYRHRQFTVFTRPNHPQGLLSVKHLCQIISSLPTLRVLSRLMILRAALQLPLVAIAADPIGSASPNGSFVLGVACMNLTLFVSGAITTVMFTLMMQCTRSESSSQTHATHYTILSTAELLGKLIFGIIASPFTDLVGYTMANLAFLLVSLLPIWFVQTRRQVLCFVPTFRTKHY